jgi:hypothetical protein
MIRDGEKVGERAAIGRRIAGVDQGRDGVGAALGDLRFCQSEIARPQHFALTHRDAAENLCKEFAKSDCRQQRFKPTEPSFRAEPSGEADHLARGLDISRQPGEPMRRALFELKALSAEPTRFADPRTDGGHRVAEQALNRRERLICLRFVEGDGIFFGGNCQGSLRRKGSMLRCSMHRRRGRCNTRPTGSHWSMRTTPLDLLS